MKRLLATTVFVLGMTHAAFAQDQARNTEDSNRNVAANFAQTSAASAPAAWLGNSAPGNMRADFAAPEGRDFGGLSLSSGVAALTSVAVPAAPSPFAPLGAPASSVSLAVPSQGVSEPYGAEGLQYRMELSLSAALVRFRSSVFSATAPGFNTSFAYYFKDKIAIEASLTTGFAPTIFANEHIKYLGYGAGPKLVLQHAKFSPWVHGIFGGAHVLPQIANSSQKGYLIQVGGGVDYQFIPRVAVKAEVDWLRTGLFGTTQNSGQAVLGLVLHF
jgi:opacity protein-like surface antigen